VTDAAQTIKAAMSVAKDVAEGRLLPSSLAAAALEECRTLTSAVVGPNDPLWPLQTEIARQVIAAGGIPANELQEWLAVQRAREPRLVEARAVEVTVIEPGQPVEGVIDDVPETGSDDRQHLMADECWCNPMTSKLLQGGGRVRQHRPEL
jgi:hypothetical protein